MKFIKRKKLKYKRLDLNDKVIFWLLLICIGLTIRIVEMIILMI